MLGLAMLLLMLRRLYVAVLWVLVQVLRSL